jgi:hypothetical protein
MHSASDRHGESRERTYSEPHRWSRVLTLLDIVRENRALMQGKTAITGEELAQCEVLLDQLLTAVGEKEQLPLSSAALKETLVRAYTLTRSTASCRHTLRTHPPSAPWSR